MSKGTLRGNTPRELIKSAATKTSGTLKQVKEEVRASFVELAGSIEDKTKAIIKTYMSGGEYGNYGGYGDIISKFKKSLATQRANPRPTHAYQGVGLDLQLASYEVEEGGQTKQMAFSINSVMAPEFKRFKAPDGKDIDLGAPGDLLITAITYQNDDGEEVTFDINKKFNPINLKTIEGKAKYDAAMREFVSALHCPGTKSFTSLDENNNEVKFSCNVDKNSVFCIDRNKAGKEEKKEASAKMPTTPMKYYDPDIDGFGSNILLEPKTEIDNEDFENALSEVENIGKLNILSLTDLQEASKEGYLRVREDIASRFTISIEKFKNLLKQGFHKSFYEKLKEGSLTGALSQIETTLSAADKKEIIEIFKDYKTCGLITNEQFYEIWLATEGLNFLNMTVIAGLADEEPNISNDDSMGIIMAGLRLGLLDQTNAELKGRNSANFAIATSLSGFNFVTAKSIVDKCDLKKSPGLIAGVFGISSSDPAKTIEIRNLWLEYLFAPKKFDKLQTSVIDEEGVVTLIHFLCKEIGSEHFIQMLIDKDKNWVETNARGGSKPLHFAVQRKDDIKAAEILIKNGAKVETIDDSGKTALHAAMNQSKLSSKILELLINNIEIPNRKNVINLKDKSGRTALHIFANNPSNIKNAEWVEINKQNATIIKKFLEEGADPSIKDKNGKTVLEIMARTIINGSDHQDAVRMIVDYYKEWLETLLKGKESKHGTMEDWIESVQSHGYIESLHNMILEIGSTETKQDGNRNNANTQFNGFIQKLQEDGFYIAEFQKSLEKYNDEDSKDELGTSVEDLLIQAQTAMRNINNITSYIKQRLNDPNVTDGNQILAAALHKHKQYLQRIKLALNIDDSVPSYALQYTTIIDKEVNTLKGNFVQLKKGVEEQQLLESSTNQIKEKMALGLKQEPTLFFDFTGDIKIKFFNILKKAVESLKIPKSPHEQKTNITKSKEGEDKIESPTSLNEDAIIAKAADDIKNLAVKNPTLEIELGIAVNKLVQGGDYSTEKFAKDIGKIISNDKSEAGIVNNEPESDEVTSLSAFLNNDGGVTETKGSPRQEEAKKLSNIMDSLLERLEYNYKAAYGSDNKLSPGQKAIHGRRAKAFAYAIGKIMDQKIAKSPQNYEKIFLPQSKTILEKLAKITGKEENVDVKGLSETIIKALLTKVKTPSSEEGNIIMQYAGSIITKDSSQFDYFKELLKEHVLSNVLDIFKPQPVTPYQEGHPAIKISQASLPASSSESKTPSPTPHNTSKTKKVEDDSGDKGQSIGS